MQMDQENRPYISWELVGNFMIDAFKAAGLPEEDAKICADVLMESDRRGIESHGVNRFKPIYLDRINAGILKTTTEYEILKETPTTLVADAHDGMGMVASYKMMKSLNGIKGRSDRNYGNECPSVDRADLRRRQYDGNEPADLRFSDG